MDFADHIVSTYNAIQKQKALYSRTFEAYSKLSHQEKGEVFMNVTSKVTNIPDLTNFWTQMISNGFDPLKPFMCNTHDTCNYEMCNNKNQQHYHCGITTIMHFDRKTTGNYDAEFTRIIEAIFKHHLTSLFSIYEYGLVRNQETILMRFCSGSKRCLRAIISILERINIPEFSSWYVNFRDNTKSNCTDRLLDMNVFDSSEFKRLVNLGARVNAKRYEETVRINQFLENYLKNYNANQFDWSDIKKFYEAFLEHSSVQKFNESLFQKISLDPYFIRNYNLFI